MVVNVALVAGYEEVLIALAGGDGESTCELDRQQTITCDAT
jgi:hypothetical protein